MIPSLLETMKLRKSISVGTAETTVVHDGLLAFTLMEEIRA